MDKTVKKPTIYTFLSEKDFIYAANTRLAGAASIAKVGEAGSGIPFIFINLYVTTGNRISNDIKANQKEVCPIEAILKAGAVIPAVPIPTYTINILGNIFFISNFTINLKAVSYTHLDVYKRQT